MRNLSYKQRLIAIAAGIGILATGSAYVYWRYLQQQWCVQFTSTGGQEVTYSRGCHSPKRYKQWAVTAMVNQNNPGNYEVAKN